MKARKKPAASPAPDVVVRTGPGSKTSAIVVLTNPAGAAAEEVRALRTKVQSQHLQAGRRVLTLCGPSPEVGCTFMAVNLAVAMSQIGVKTLLVDADLRYPSVQDYFNLKDETGGLRAYLLSVEADIIEFIHEDVYPNLSVLPAGEADPGAQELLAGWRFAGGINTCLRDYDLTIIDTPPANSCADGRLISAVAGSSMIVVRKNKSLVSDVKTLANELMGEGATVIGAVLDGY